MRVGDPLDTCLPGGDAATDALARTVLALAGAAAELSHLVSRGALEGALGAEIGEGHEAGDAQRALDVVADDLFFRALADAPVAAVASEEREGVVVLDERAPLAVAVDPLDGSSNIDINAPVGAIFSIMDAARDAPAEAPFLAPGTRQRAAGIVVFGPATTMLLSVGRGVDLHVLDRASGAFRLARADVRVPVSAKEFAINASNRRHWEPGLEAWFEHCLAGRDGPLARDHNMRWIASLVAETFRIFTRGGVYLYPADQRKGYERGRLRLVYEGKPVAFLTEQAGGLATDGRRRILDLEAGSLHERCPFVFGSREMVETIGSYLSGSRPG
ncbi:class 1 fructose-bisphosphatase [Salinarimonas ramus]|uniref:Fructose-1,6-bisphosphatase class 1 n=1 Tax=Salinarimonas ramus TaxID=690164 RepID=A0A917Q6W4_9HYPH|nr:class 1 fructose-bisphosphatase [Salinarimonas ramus]GGK31493.1 fructose-1,6-bisphosphatase class 1 [Salinarimonas ramus]